MALHPLRRLLALLLVLTLCCSGSLWACFGPKLYVGVPAGADGEVLYALSSLYLKEKTGIETVRVDLQGKDPLQMLAAEELDLAFVDGKTPNARVVLSPQGLPLLAAGRRPLEELQFTTAVPALEKLDALLRGAPLDRVLEEVRQGAPPVAAVRRMLMARGWI